MAANEIVEVKTIAVGPPDAPFHALMIAANVTDPATLKAFVAEIVARFKAQRMISPPSTTHYLLSIRGETTAGAVRALWLAYVAADPVLAAFVRGLKVADVVRAGRTGPAVDQTSLLG